MYEKTHPLAGILMTKGETDQVSSIFNHWLKENDTSGNFVPLVVEPKNLAQVLKALPKVGFVGLTISRALQKMVLDHVDIITDRAALMSGANTIIFRKDGKIHADNTGGVGFIENIRQHVPGWNPKSGPAAVMGAGVAAREVVAALLEIGVDEIRIANRTKPKAEALKAEFGTRIQVYDWVNAGNMLENATLIVNATSLGSKDHPEMRVPFDGLIEGAIVNDLTLSLNTRLMRHAKDAGCFVVDGIGMSLYQAVPAFERWFGVKPEVDMAARSAFLAGLDT